MKELIALAGDAEASIKEGIAVFDEKRKKRYGVWRFMIEILFSIWAVMAITRLTTDFLLLPKRYAYTKSLIEREEKIENYIKEINDNIREISSTTNKYGNAYCNEAFKAFDKE